jgi:hypothetical protein
MRSDRYEYHPYDARSNIPAPSKSEESDHEFWAMVVQYSGAGLLLAGATFLIFFT